MFWSKEKQDLLNESRYSLRKAEQRTEELKQENLAVHEENKDLRAEIDTIRDCLNEIEKELNKQQYNSIENFKNKIKSILKTAKSF
jgi:archaellum component FlaC